MASTTAQPISTQRAARYEFLDLLRGIAVLLMIEGHAMRALLHWNIRATVQYDFHELFHGLPAPIFIFAAGAALAISRRDSTILGAAAQPTAGKRNWRRELRLLNVLIIAYALQLSDFSFFRTFFASTPEKLSLLLNFNVLQCIVVSVLLVRCISSLNRPEGKLSQLMVMLTAGIGLLTPLVWLAVPHLPIWLGTILSREYSSYFPLFPYAGFALGGAAWGLQYKIAQRDNAEAGFLHRTILFSGLAVIACTALAGVPWPELYSDFWWSSPWYLWLRIALLTLFCAFLRRWELDAAGTPGGLYAFLALLGRQSFYIYVGHLLVLYGSSYNYNWNMLRHLGSSLTFWPAAAATATLALVMIASAIAWDWAKWTQPMWAHRFKWALAAYLLTVFIIS